MTEKEVLIHYKELILKVEEFISKEEYENIEEALNKRESLKPHIEKIDKNILKELVEELDIINIENRVMTELEKNKNYVRQQLLNIKNSRQANNSYRNVNKKNHFSSYR